MSGLPRVLMFGWEYPPFNSGGLGTACQGLSDGLSDENIEVTFVLPHKIPATSRKVTLHFADEKEVTMDYYLKLANPYISTQLYKKLYSKVPINSEISSDLITEVFKYSINTRNVIKERPNFDLIHAHDWLTIGAGLEAKHLSGKPMILHMHATELDRTGFNSGHPYIIQVEKEGMKRADKIIAVSNYTKDIIHKHYDIPRHKIDVVHNGIHLEDFEEKFPKDVAQIKQFFGKLVLYVGRLTMQKGVDYFLKAAQLVHEQDPEVSFVIAGSGDMEGRLIEDCARYGLSHKVFFTGFLRGKELSKLFQAADLFVMPSVSEPYGIAALEAAANGTPILVSKQSGVAEVLSHALKADFWNVEDIADKMHSVVSHRSLYETLQQNCGKEIRNHTWHSAARKMLHIYNRLLA